MRSLFLISSIAAIILSLSTLCTGHIHNGQDKEEANNNTILDKTLDEVDNSPDIDTDTTEQTCVNASHTEQTGNTKDDPILRQIGNDDDNWIYLFKNDTENTLYLQACLKFVIKYIDHFGKNRSFVADSTLIPRAFDISCSKTSNLEMIRCDIAFQTNVSMYIIWRLVLKIYLSSNETYYWGFVGLFYYLPDNATSSTSAPPLWAENDKLRKYETMLNSSYSCKPKDMFFLTDQVAVVIKDLKYRAFGEINDLFPDEDVGPSSSAIWEFFGIAVSMFLLLIVVMVAVLGKCYYKRHRTVEH